MKNEHVLEITDHALNRFRLRFPDLCNVEDPEKDIETVQGLIKASSVEKRKFKGRTERIYSHLNFIAFGTFDKFTQNLVIKTIVNTRDSISYEENNNVLDVSYINSHG